MSRQPWEVEQVLEQIERWRLAAQRSGRETDPEARDWRRRLERLAREATRRAEARDFDWFWWVAEYGAMISATVREDFERFEEPLLRGMSLEAGRKRSGDAAAAARRRIGEKTGRRVRAGEKDIVSERQARRHRRGR